MEMSCFNKSSSWDQTFRWAGGLLIVLFLLFYIYDALKPPFFTTSSPDNTYAVGLYGQKERPALFTVEVGAVVLKNGRTFWPYQTLHSGDFMDLSFELGWPDHRWIGENILQFYNEENFSDSKYQVINLSNNSSKTIKHLRLLSEDKFLLFDIQSGATVQLSASPPRGDSAWVALEGEFYDGQTFKEFNKNRSCRVRVDNQLPAFHVEVAGDVVKITSSCISGPLISHQSPR